MAEKDGKRRIQEIECVEKEREREREREGWYIKERRKETESEQRRRKKKQRQMGKNESCRGEEKMERKSHVWPQIGQYFIP
jgi:hypothetical protein